MNIQSLKHNRLWILGTATALGLLIGAVYSLFLSFRAEKETDKRLDVQVALRHRLETADPHPGTGGIDNLSEAKQDERRIVALRDELKKQLMPILGASVSDSREFKLLLDITQAELERKARAAGVLVPQPYSFTFDYLKRAVNLDPAWLQPWSQQLAEVKALCEILFEAQIHSVESMRRVAMSSEQTSGSDYLPRPAATNTLAVMMPYEITFKSFSTELANAINRLSRSPHGFIIRSLNTEVTSPSTSGHSDLGSATNPGEAGATGQAPGISQWNQRYGWRSQGYHSTQEPVPAVRSQPVTVISEQPLRVTMLIDAVRLR